MNVTSKLRQYTEVHNIIHYFHVSFQACMVMTVSLLLYWGLYGIVAVSAAVGSVNDVPVRLFALAPLVAKLAPIGNTFLVHWSNQQTSLGKGEEKKSK